MRTKGLKKRMVMLLILLAGWHMTTRPEVIITGIMHGTLTGGSPKAIELFIAGTEDLNNYEIWRSVNGGAFGSASSMSGVYTNTFVFLVKTDHVTSFHNVFGSDGIFSNVLPMAIVSGNGNDGFQVRLKAGSVIIDQVWLEDETDSYRNSYWYRKHGTGPDGGWSPSAWETPGNDALVGLDAAGLRAAVPFGTYALAWEGLTTDWNNASNWSPGIIPSFQTNVLVRETAANFPVINNLPENPAVCMNLTVADTARLTVNAGNALTVFGELNLETQDQEGPDRGLILKSENSLTPSGSLILWGNTWGTAIAERFIAKDNGWHFLSSPVEEQAFQPEFVPEPVDQSFDLYYWDENIPWSEGWINSRDEDGQWNPLFEDAFIPGKGYLVAYSSANGGDLTRKFKGLLNSGDQDIPVGYSVNYWNLLGNPFSCALDWSSGGIDKGLIAACTMYVWDPALNENQGGYRAHNGTTGVPAGTTSVIPAMQGFFVQSLDFGNLSIDISNDDPLVHGNQPFYKNRKELANERLRLKISKNQLSDETLIYFDPAATNQYDPEFDAEKLFNDKAGCPEIYSLAETDHSLCINILAETPVSIPLGISYTEADTITLTAFDFDGIPPETGIFLEDNLQDNWINLREQPEYRFFQNPVQSGSRLTLHFMDVTPVAGHAQPDGLNFWCSGKRIYISNPENINGFLSSYSIDGRYLESYRIEKGSQAIEISYPAGVYAIRISTPLWTSCRKIFIY
jgi:hypothetical protein